MATLDRLGAGVAANLVRRESRRWASPISPPPPAPDLANPAGLTDRQLEVLQLLAEGLTNAEIADRLVVSVRTVDHHVAAILAKLNVGSRREAPAPPPTSHSGAKIGSDCRCAPLGGAARSGHDAHSHPATSRRRGPRRREVRPAGRRRVLLAAYQEYATALPPAVFGRYLAEILDVEALRERLGYWSPGTAGGSWARSPTTTTPPPRGSGGRPAGPGCAPSGWSRRPAGWASAAGPWPRARHRRAMAG